QAVSDGASAVLILSVLLFNILARLLGKVVYKRMTSS
ncbi:phosphate ABC transporter, permease protein PstA, partial [Listeria monocytogenes]|nr:phosphate ABC transporter, permease protein PstA [Listeria monocytogenes]